MRDARVVSCVLLDTNISLSCISLISLSLSLSVYLPRIRRRRRRRHCCHCRYRYRRPCRRHCRITLLRRPFSISFAIFLPLLFPFGFFLVHLNGGTFDRVHRAARHR